ncbi:MAG: putative hydro-lyase [Hyphomicrobiales bacterium]|nr:putative hydro-lyase [Hyphomicrobiales bacterium]MBV8765802.1 putative hydro-lyase [Hyphomicrobiales bacterium]MBV9431998.1 putative hydro-lyase [Hyphomicrobiales bacterium]MBV9739364.1 putative hydro-lyase [Hyphomicrobiales bacterium]
MPKVARRFDAKLDSPGLEPDLSSPKGARAASRSGALDGPTSGLAPGFVQGNLAVLPADLAGDFLHFCQRNPKPCPLIGVSEAGDPRLHLLGEDLDIRTDIPRYRVWKNGALVDEPQDILKWWRSDLVAFILGCSHSFEEALIEDGLSVRHIDRSTTVPMYRTNIACVRAGAFQGPMVVSMRPFRPADAIRAVQITTRFPAVHGAPVHIGLPQLIGIEDIAKPDYGEAVPIADDELPVFWACGVTPQAVIQAVRPPFAITHAPGRMIVTDIRNSRLAAL